MLIAADESRIITVDAGGGQKTQLTAWETATGKRLWVSEEISGQWNVQQMGYRMLTPCAGNTEKVAVCVFDYRTRKQVLAAFDGKTGKLLWRSDLPMNAQWAMPAMGARHVAAIVNNQANAAELRVWELDSGKLIDSRAHAPGQLLVYQEALLALVMGTLEHLKPAAPPEPGK